MAVFTADSDRQCDLWEQNQFFAAILKILVLATKSKREKDWFWPPKVKNGYNFSLRCPD